MKINQSQSGRLTSNMAEINVTPLVDVMLVLLIIFMITAPMMHSGIRINLPSVESRTNPSPGGLVLSITKDNYIYLDDQIINIALLETQLNNYFMNREKKIVFLKADAGVPYGDVISVMDIIKKVGVETVGLIVQPKRNR